MIPDSAVQIAGIVRESIVDGPGFRFTVFTQGCPHHCDGCHNPQTHPFEGGSEVTIDKLLEELKKDGLHRGVTLSGGEPFCQSKPLAILAKEVHNLGFDVISYSGYTFEQLIDGSTDENGWLNLLENIDYLIDGKFILGLRTLDSNYKGSSNQRIISVKKSLACGHVIEVNL